MIGVPLARSGRERAGRTAIMVGRCRVGDCEGRAALPMIGATQRTEGAGPMRNARHLLVAAAAVGLVLSPPAQAAGRAVTVSGTESDPAGVQPDGVGCSVSEGGCRLVLTGHATYAGGLAGTSSYVLRFDPVVQPDGVHYTGSEHFDRLTTPCGTGSADVALQGVYQTTTFDPATHTSTIVEHGTFLATSGGLEGMTGSFTATVRDHNDRTTDGRYTGVLHCRP